MRKQEALKVIADLEESLRNAVPWDCTFVQFLNDDGVKNRRGKVQAQMKDGFVLWKNSWMSPRVAKLREIVEKA